jgi:Zn-dependent protease
MPALARGTPRIRASYGACLIRGSCPTLNRLASGIDFTALFFQLVVLVFSLTVHEAAHAWTAWRLGDNTARDLGRISLNPVVHIDPVGTILLPLVAMVTHAPLLGWAKPVPVRTRGLRRPRRDLMLIAAAGPASNLVLAAVAAIALRFVPLPDSDVAGTLSGFDLATPLGFLLLITAKLNLILAVFNLVPIPPLDGGNVLANLLPTQLSYRFEQLRPYGIFVLYGLMLTGLLWMIIGPPYLFLAALLQL